MAGAWLGVAGKKRAGFANDSSLSFASDGAWCWFQDPRAVHIRHRYRRTYATWVTRAGALQIGAHDHDARETSILELKSGWNADDHGSGSLLVLPDCRLMAFYSQHNGTGLFCRTTSRPEDIDEWDDEIAVTRAPGLTYANPVYLSDERLFRSGAARAGSLSTQLLRTGKPGRNRAF